MSCAISEHCPNVRIGRDVAKARERERETYVVRARRFGRWPGRFCVLYNSRSTAFTECEAQEHACLGRCTIGPNVAVVIDETVLEFHHAR